MSAFTSAAQGDNCCGQRKNSFNLPKTFHDLCFLVWFSRGGKYSNSKRFTGSALVLFTSITHHRPPHPACDSTSTNHTCGWPRYHTEVDYEKQCQKCPKTHRAHVCHSKPEHLEHHYDGIDSVSGSIVVSPKISARARLHERACSRQRQT